MMDDQQFIEESDCVEFYNEFEQEEAQVDLTSLSVNADNSKHETKSPDHGTSAQQEVCPVVSEKAESMFDDQFAFLYFTVAGQDERLDAFELQRIMGMVFPSNRAFSLEACRSMICSVDNYRMGRLNYAQFQELWIKIMRWSHTFNRSERDNDGKIDHSELCSGLRKLGLRLQEGTARKLMNRFQNKDGLIELDDFIQICCKADGANVTYGAVSDGSADFESFFTQIMHY